MPATSGFLKDDNTKKPHCIQNLWYSWFGWMYGTSHASIGCSVFPSSWFRRSHQLGRKLSRLKAVFVLIPKFVYSCYVVVLITDTDFVQPCAMFRPLASVIQYADLSQLSVVTSSDAARATGVAQHLDFMYSSVMTSSAARAMGLAQHVDFSYSSVVTSSDAAPATEVVQHVDFIGIRQWWRH